jgi:hypothetical protein
MATVGEALRIGHDLITFAARRRRIIEVGGGLAVIRTFIEDDPLSPPWLLGLAAGGDGSSEYAFHRLRSDPAHTCASSSDCMGATGSPEGLVVATTGPDDLMLSADNRLAMLADLASRGDDSSQNSGSLALAREFYEKGHVFDPQVYPTLHAAMQETVWPRPSVR